MRKLKKELNLLAVFSIATGATLSSGYFLLPGIAAQAVGPTIVFCYFLSVIPLIPSMFSIVELATAMPKSGGTYYFLDRSMGPLIGAIGGLGIWCALILKSSFALVGMGAYLSLFVGGISFTNDFSFKLIACAFAVFFCVLNILGAKTSGTLQIFFVIGMLGIVAVFTGTGLTQLNVSNFEGFFDPSFDSIIATSGLIYVSYIGITKVASVAEEVKDPEKNLPRGIFLALFVSFVVYVLGTTVMVGIVPIDIFSESYTPLAKTADYLFSASWWKYLISVAAILAFFSAANAGVLSASRYPMAMSRDHLIPSVFKELIKNGSPRNSIIFTTATIILTILFLDPLKIAKLAGAFQLLVFALTNLALIVMRESHIESYDPGYKSPLYPWMQIFGIIVSLMFIGFMGWLPILFSASLILISVIWYYYYARNKVTRDGAIYHIFERLGRNRFDGLDIELRGILKEKGLREGDPFDEVVARSHVIESSMDATLEDIFESAADYLSTKFEASKEQFFEDFMEGTKVGATPVSHGAALPHLRLSGISEPELVLIRAKGGVKVDIIKKAWALEAHNEPIYAFFFLVSPDGSPGQHLRFLAELAEKVDQHGFIEKWKKAKNGFELKEALLSNRSKVF